MSVVNLVEREDGPKAANVSTMLRRMADRIDSGEQQAEFMVIMSEPSTLVRPEIFSFGPNRPVPHVIGLLHDAMVQLSSMRDS